MVNGSVLLLLSTIVLVWWRSFFKFS